MPMLDTLVVGAGPAGSLTAYCLSKHDRSVALIDSASFPRHKPCGGGLPLHAVDLLDRKGFQIDSLVKDVADQVEFLYESGDPVTESLTDAPVFMVDRGEFDHSLAEAARRQGVSFQDETRFLQMKIKSDYCEVVLPDRRLKARFVVGADGAHSEVGRSVGLMRSQNCGVAMDAEVKVSPKIQAQNRSKATFDVNFVDQGYGWIFPKKDCLSMGVGGYRRDVTYPRSLEDYIKQSVDKRDIHRKNVYGHPLPFFQGTRDVVRGRVGLVGDAAGMVDALSGEGIFYALRGGEILAETINWALEEDVSTLSRYQERLRETVFKELGWSYRLAQVFFRFPRKCYEHGVKRPKIVRWIKRAVTSQQSYDEIYEHIWSEVKRRLGNRVLSTLGF